MLQLLKINFKKIISIKNKMIQQTQAGIELRFEEPVNVADLAARINGQVGLTQAQVKLDLRHGPRIVVSGLTGIHGSLAYTINLEEVPEPNTPVGNITSRDLTIPCMVGYEDLKIVHDQLYTQR